MHGPVAWPTPHNGPRGHAQELLPRTGAGARGAGTDNGRGAVDSVFTTASTTWHLQSLAVSIHPFHRKMDHRSEWDDERRNV